MQRPDTRHTKDWRPNNPGREHNEGKQDLHHSCHSRGRHWAFELICSPDAFDVIVASNVFGDIIADEAAGLTGAGEFLPAGSLNAGKKGIYGPNQLHQVHEELAGTGKANPMGMILAGAMMLEYSFGLHREAESIRKAVERVMEHGIGGRPCWSGREQTAATRLIGEAVRACL